MVLHKKAKKNICFNIWPRFQRFFSAAFSAFRWEFQGRRNPGGKGGQLPPNLEVKPVPSNELFVLRAPHFRSFRRLSIPLCYSAQYERINYKSCDVDRRHRMSTTPTILHIVLNSLRRGLSKVLVINIETIMKSER